MNARRLEGAASPVPTPTKRRVLAECRGRRVIPLGWWDHTSSGPPASRERTYAL
jgi:hypothetical protein